MYLRNRAGIPGRQEVIAYNEVVEGQHVRRTEGTFLAICRSMVSVLTTTKLLSMRYVLILLLGDRRVPGRRVQLMRYGSQCSAYQQMQILKGRRRQGGVLLLASFLLDIPRVCG